MTDMRERIWSEPLTANERQIIGDAIADAPVTDRCAKWLCHVLCVYDGRTASLESELSVLRGQLAAAETERDEFGRALARIGELNPALAAEGKGAWQTRAEAAEAALAAATAERDEAQYANEIVREQQRTAEARLRTSRETHDATLTRLREALERVTRNFKLAVAGKPVRDMAETLAEVDAALAASGDAPDAALAASGDAPAEEGT